MSASCSPPDIAAVRAHEFPVAVQFVNFRD
jgi:uncharacterized protein YajQ (UPF0234 family)